MKKEIPSKKQKRALVELMNELDWMFSLKNHERTLVYMEKNDPDSEDCVADITITEDYMRIKIRLYPNFWEFSPYYRRMFLLHEMCHTLIQPIQREAQELRLGNLRTDQQVTFATEKVTSNVTVILDDLLRGGRRFMLAAYQKYSRSELSKSKKKKSMKTPASKTKAVVAKKAMPAIAKKGSAKKSK